MGGSRGRDVWAEPRCWTPRGRRCATRILRCWATRETQALSQVADYTYNGAGNVAEKRDAKGQCTSDFEFLLNGGK